MSKKNLIIALSFCLLVTGTAVNAKPKSQSKLKGLLKNIATTTPMTATSTPSFATSTLDVICIQKAVDIRDNDIIASIDAYHTSVKSALETRRDALKNAWAISNAKERKATIKKIWTDFSKVQKEVKKNFQKARNAAWKQFRAGRKQCGKQAISDDSAGEGMDSQL